MTGSCQSWLLSLDRSQEHPTPSTTDPARADSDSCMGTGSDMPRTSFGVLCQNHATPPFRRGVAPPLPQRPGLSQVNSPLKRCRAPRGCRTYTAACRATLCQLDPGNFSEASLTTGCQTLLVAESFQRLHLFRALDCDPSDSGPEIQQKFPKSHPMPPGSEYGKNKH